MASAAAAGSCRLGGRPYHKSSVDSQFADDDDDTELTVLDACIDCDDEGLYDLIQDGVTWDQVNERDKSGRVRARNNNTVSAFPAAAAILIMITVVERGKLMPHCHLRRP